VRTSTVLERRCQTNPRKYQDHSIDRSNQILDLQLLFYLCTKLPFNNNKLIKSDVGESLNFNNLTTYHAISSDSTSAINSQADFNFPIVIWHCVFWPQLTFLTAQRWCQAHLIIRCYGCSAVMPKRNGAVFEHQMWSFETQLVFKSLQYVDGHKSIQVMYNCEKQSECK